MATSRAGNNPLADAIHWLRGTAVPMAMLRRTNAFLELVEFANPVGAENKSDRPVRDRVITYICICVGDIDRHYARLVAAGVPFTFEAMA
jgi:hypothetical protein